MSAVKKPVELARIISYRPEKSIEATIEMTVSARILKIFND